MVERDLNQIKQLDLKLVYVCNTHAHADHLTGTGRIKQLVPHSVSIISRHSGARSDVHVDDGDVIECGDELRLNVLATPGHTSGCVSFHSSSGGFVLTGDALLIRGCGRTDFQQGSPSQLYQSIQNKLFNLPNECLVYPAHDYNGRTVSSIGEEKLFNPRLTNKTEAEFVHIMENLKLDPPKMIGMFLSANL